MRCALLLAIAISMLGCRAPTKSTALRLVADTRVRVELTGDGLLMVDGVRTARFRPDGVVAGREGREVARLVPGGFRTRGAHIMRVETSPAGDIQIGPAPDGSLWRIAIWRDRSVLLPTKRPIGRALRFENLTPARRREAMLILVLILARECQLWPEPERTDCVPLMRPLRER